MNPLHPLFFIIILGIAYISAATILYFYKPIPISNQNISIEGLRGFLGVSVFIHHCSIWHQFINTGSWEAPKSNLYNQLGQTSVVLFFMITCYLFLSKLINSKDKTFNWASFFKSRLLRIVPMYFFVVLLIIVIIGICSFHQKESALNLFLNIVNWLFFTINKSPNINNFSYTNLIISCVNWSLPFEWLFYLTFPILGLLLLKEKPKKIYLWTSLISIGYFFYVGKLISSPNSYFIGGAIAPFCIKYNWYLDILKNKFSDYIIFICLLLICFFETANNFLCMLLITIVFTLIAVGNTFFGVLESKKIHFLGQICYSIYLLHGIILFLTFYLGIGLENSKMLNPQKYCYIIFGLTPILIFLSYLGYTYIEKPFIYLYKKSNN